MPVALAEAVSAIVVPEPRYVERPQQEREAAHGQPEYEAEDEQNLERIHGVGAIPLRLPE
jgi:hypothetical protein